MYITIRVMRQRYIISGVRDRNENYVAEFPKKKWEKNEKKTIKRVPCWTLKMPRMNTLS